MRKIFHGLLTAAALLSSLISAATAFAQGDPFPNKPIQVIVSTAPGSFSEQLVRFIGGGAQKTLNQPLVVITRASASGTLAADTAKRAAPDGYTLILGGNTVMAANVHLIKNLSYDPIRDFEPVTLASINPLLLVVRSALPINSVPDLIAYSKSRPGQLNYGIGNAGGKVAVQLLNSLTGMTGQEISFNGTSQAILELVAGRLDFMIVDPLVADPFIKQGVLRPLAISSNVRLPSMANIPTMVEAGVPGYDYASFTGFWAPKGTPKAVIDTLNAAFVNVLASPAAAEYASRAGMIAKSTTPQALLQFNKDQIATWERLVKISGLQPQ